MSSKYILATLFFLFVLGIGCIRDHKLSDESNEDMFQSEEEKYFEDYESPNQKWGFIDKTGSIAIQVRFDAVGKFSEGRAAANMDGKWGYIDLSGKTMVEYQYKAAHPYQNGMAKVQSFDGQYHFLNMDGNPIQTFNFIQAGDFNEGLAKVELGNKWGYIDKSGALAIEPAFDKAWAFQNGFAKVKSSGKYGLIQQNGQYTLHPQFDHLSAHSEGIVVAKKSNEYFYYEVTGELLHGPFTKATAFHNGSAFVITNESLSRIETDGTLNLIHLEDLERKIAALPRYIGSNRWLARSRGFFGIIDEQGQPITDFIYQQINHFYDGIAAYRRGDLWGYIDLNGRELIDPVFGLAWDFSDNLARAAFRDGIAYVNKNMEPPFIPRFRDLQNFTEGLAAVQEF